MIKVNRALVGLALVVLTSLPAYAGSAIIVVEDAWSRASIGTSRPGAAYLTIRNTGDESAILTAIQTDLAMMPEVHLSSTNDQGVSKMSPAGDIEIAPGASVSLAPGGLHAMLMRLQRPMIEGESFDLTLVFADGSEVSVEVPILSIAARGPGN